MAQASVLNGHDPAAIAQAAQHLAAGELVAFPTETVYGLGARADDDAAVAKIFAAKGRPSDHPLIVHVADAQAALHFTPSLPAMAQQLMDRFWPGPLTVIVPRQPGLATAAAGGQDSIGLRCPSHPVARALLQAAVLVGVPGVAAPSANRFGQLSPTLAVHVQAEFDDLGWVVDGGACEVGIESSIVDCRGDRPVLLRPGLLTREALESVLGQPLAERDAHSPRASGTLESHYAPRAPLRLMNRTLLAQALAMLGDAGSLASMKLAVYSRLPVAGLPAGVMGRHMPDQAHAVAHELFAVLRAFDDDGAKLIWVETPPDTDEWEGVRDRLQRAAAT